MDSKRKSFDSSTSSFETSIITLIPCDYESSDEGELENVSHDSVDSSELVDSSDEENEPTKIEKISSLKKGFTKNEGSNIKNDEIICH